MSDDVAQRSPRPAGGSRDGAGSGVGRSARLLHRGMRLSLVVACAASVASALLLASVLLLAERTPAEWAPYILKRSSGHRPSIEAAGRFMSAWLEHADRLGGAHDFTLPAGIGAAPGRSGPVPAGRVVPVASLPALLDALGRAAPGDVIEVEPGVYRRADFSIALRQPGRPDAPITLRAARLGDVVIESAAPIGFTVSAPFWKFENLVVRGACFRPADCEHAFHVVGGASSIIFRNDRLEDFNAALKINGENGAWPDGGLIEGTTLVNNFARETTKPITMIDLVGADHWTVRGNLLADFARAWPGAPTYGAFAKGGGVGTIFERNVVVCEWHLRGTPGQHIGLSLGGGGTGTAFVRAPAQNSTEPSAANQTGTRQSGSGQVGNGQTGIGAAGAEQTGGLIRDNLIVACNDDGIYLNQAARSVVEHNTLLDTAGIEASYPQTSATVTANLVDGVIRSRSGASVQEGDNAASSLLALFLGQHRQRAAFFDPATLDLRWRQAPDRVSDGGGRSDLCGQPRDGSGLIGAFEDYAACHAR